MNVKYISEDYDLSVFTDKVGRIVDWHYGTDFDDVDEVYWEMDPQPELGNEDVFKDAVRYAETFGGEAPHVYIASTEEERSGAAGPVLLLLEWPIIAENGNRNPAYIYSVHTAEDGELVPQLPPILAAQFAKAVTKNNNE